MLKIKKNKKAYMMKFINNSINLKMNNTFIWTSKKMYYQQITNVL